MSLVHQHPNSVTNPYVPTGGYMLEQVDVIVPIANTVVVTAGNCVNLPPPLTNAIPGVTSSVQGYYAGPTGGVGCNVTTAANSKGHYIMGIALEGGTGDANLTVKIKVRLRGVVYATLNTTSDITYGGGGLVNGANGTLVNTPTWPGTPAGTQPIPAIPLESTGTTAATKLVLFDGINKFGSVVV